MSAQLYSKRDVRRMMAVLCIFVVSPCVLLVFLAHQSVRVLRQTALDQHRAACRHELQDLGRNAHQQLDAMLEHAGNPLRAYHPAQPAFWNEAMRTIESEKSIRALLVLGSDGRLGRPIADIAPPADIPQLSFEHPAYAILREARRARWAEGDDARSLAAYRLIEGMDRIPRDVRLSVWAEMAQCELRLDNATAALGFYDQFMNELARDPAGAGSLMPLLNAVDTAKRLGDPERAERWGKLLLATCEKRSMAADLDELALVIRKQEEGREQMPDETRQQLARIERVKNARALTTDFVHSFSSGPFPFLPRPNPHDFEPAALPWRFANLHAPPETSRLLVDTRTPLVDGAWLAFDIDTAELQQRLLEPALQMLRTSQGGRIELANASTSSNGAPAPEDNPDSILYRLPSPLDFWTIRYQIEPSSFLASLSASQLKFRFALIATALALAVLGFVIPALHLNRSLRLAGLQADVMDRISHELKTPITAVSVLTETLAARDDGEPASRKKMMALLREETQRLTQLTERLFNFAQQRRGKLRLNRTSARLDELVASAIRIAPLETGIDANRMELSIEPADYCGLFDRQAVETILRNLLDNAAKFSDAPARIQVALRRMGHEALLTIADNGWGMDHKTLRGLFKPYFRADTTLAARVPGLGIGLTIVHSLIRAHGGSITVQSEPYKGSTFEIRLPLSSQEGPTT